MPVVGRGRIEPGTGNVTYSADEARTTSTQTASGTTAISSSSPLSKLRLTGEITGEGWPIVNANLTFTGVNPGTYSNALLIVDDKGRISHAENGVGGTTTVVAGAGLTGGTITTTGTLALSNTGVAPGTYSITTLVVDAKGRITNASSGTGGGSAGAHSFSFFIPDTPVADKTLYRVGVRQGFRLEYNNVDSISVAETAPADDVSFPVYRNDTVVGSFAYTASATSVMFSHVSASHIDYATGDIFSVRSPVSMDNTIANIGFTFRGPMSSPPNYPVVSISDGVLSGDLDEEPDYPNVSISSGVLSGTIDPAPDPEIPVPTGDPVFGALSTVSNQIVDANLNVVRLKSINWFGGEGTNFTPHGTWGRSYEGILDQIKSFGFNTVRLPLSPAVIETGRMPISIASFYNPTLDGLTAIEVIDKIVEYCEQIELYVVLDLHRMTAGAGADTTIGTGVLSEVIEFWEFLATRYQNSPAVIGADVYNEPHALEWNVWAGIVEAVGDAIHDIAPHWLIMCEGVGSYEGQTYWWGGALMGVADRPVQLALPNKLVYSPHEYAHSVSDQPWLASTTNSVAGYPESLRAVWRNAWGHIFENKIAPLWIGEFGGKLGFDGNGGNDTDQVDSSYERQWLATLIEYINGDLDGDGDNDLTDGRVGISFAYWSLNPNSADTGGLLQDDFVTPQSGKIALLDNLLS